MKLSTVAFPNHSQQADRRPRERKGWVGTGSLRVYACTMVQNLPGSSNKCLSESGISHFQGLNEVAILTAEGPWSLIVQMAPFFTKFLHFYYFNLLFRGLQGR